MGYLGASIRNTYAFSTVMGTTPRTGGLVGRNGSIGSISRSYAANTVTGTDYVGGLVGEQSSGSVSNSSATGSVSGKERVGGLVGYSNGEISGSFAASTVTGTGSVGGLVGSSDGNINNSSATGLVFGIEQVGGLVGRNGSIGSISRSYAASTVTGRDDAGGLVGFSNGEITDGYAKGSVFGSGDNIGGLVGYLDGSIRNTYAVSTVTGTTTRVGGLVGFSVREDSVLGSYYTGQENGLGEHCTYQRLACPTAPGAMCSLPAGLVTYAGWSSRIWDFGGIDDLPQLRIEEGDGGDLTAIPLRVRVYLGGAVR